ncbi:MAG TPA: thiamine-phosphate kinase [Longimicrobiales bacterium]|nr:thiamine-phosphate kinase [Longimicrobiales bacterium]
MTAIPLGRGAEFGLIRQFLDAAAMDDQPAIPDAVRVGPGDDCAVVRGDGIALSVDMSVEGVHFLREWIEPEEIGYRAAAAALSDLAAVAAVPIGILVALAIDPSDAAVTAPRVMEGARAAAAGVGAVLLGGDLTRTAGAMVVDVVVVGNAVRPALRSGARPGDSLWVSGELGAAAAAVHAWKCGREPESAARIAFALPAPRTAEAVWLADRGVVTALIDLSDGLAGDVGHIAAASDVRIVVDAAAVPIHPIAQLGADDVEHGLRLALTGGEDYELCFTAPAGAVERVAALFTETFGLRLTRVGSVLAGGGVFLRDYSGTVDELRLAGYDHLG